MATFLDVSGVFSYYAPIFVFLFALIGVFGLLSYIKFLGNNKVINATLSFIIAGAIMMSNVATKVVVNLAPWLGLLFVFIVILAIGASILTGGNAEALDIPGIKHLFFTLLVGVLLITTVGTIRTEITVPCDNVTTSDECDDERDYSQVSHVLFDPTFMGAALLLIIAIFAIALLASGKT